MEDLPPFRGGITNDSANSTLPNFIPTITPPPLNSRVRPPIPVGGCINCGSQKHGRDQFF